MKDITNGFTTTTADKYGEALGLIGLMPESTVYQKQVDDYLVSIGTGDNNDGFCQIDSLSNYSCLAYSNDSDPWFAYRVAAVETFVFDAMDEEGNCEDSVNSAAYSAFSLVFGGHPENAEDYAELDNLLGIARDYVRDFCHEHGFEWEEF